MASKLLRIEDRAGRRVAVYESGLERDADTGLIVKPAPGTLIQTGEKSTLLHRARREKYKRRLRAGLVKAAQAGLFPAGTLPRTSAEVFAEAGVMLFEQVVMNSEAYPRDRLEAYKELGKQADVLSDPDSAGAGLAPGGAGLVLAGLNAATAATLARLLSDVQRVQENNLVNVVDGESMDVE